jgi:23S rRNA pseudouridine955/2504/2580 synthase
LDENRRKDGVSHAQIDADMAGQRLDNFLLGRLKGVPRSHVYRLIRSGQVRVNSGRVQARYRLKAGDRVRVPPLRQREPGRPMERAEGLDWLEQSILFEDDRLLVVDKPAGLAVHGGSGLSFGLIEGLRSLRPGLKTLELVHRLDRGTSGCVMVAKRRSALRQLHALMRDGGIEKRYLALVKGRWQHGSIDIDIPLAVRRDRPGAKVEPAAAGKPALSRFGLAADCGPRASLVDVELATGRTHQIRVHAAAVGHPVAGDERYGDREFNAQCELLGLKRMFLHAQLISFVWPESDTEFIVTAPLPPELHAFLDALS